MWRRPMGYRVLDSLLRSALACPGGATYLLRRRAVRRSFLCARHLWPNDWLLRAQPRCGIPPGGANFRHDGVSSCRYLPLSHRVRRFDWEACIRLVVRTEVVISVANHERLQPVSFNCTCGYNCCAVGVP